MKKIIISLLTLTVLVGGAIIFFTAAKTEKITIAGIVVQNDIYMRTVQVGMKETGAKMGIDVLLGNSDNKVDKEAQLIDTYIARGVKAIVIQPLSEQGSAAALNRAAKAGIKIILMGTKANVPYETFISSENYALGKAAGDYAKQVIGNKLGGKEIKVGTVSFVAQFPESAKARTSGFTDQLKSLPKFTIVSQQDAWLAEQAIRVVGDMLTANPDINVIHAANEGGTIGAVQAVKNAGKQGKVFVFGTDGSDQIVQLLQSSDNILQMSSAQRPYDIGKLGVENALKAINGEKMEKEIIVPVRPLIRGDDKELAAFKEELKKLQ